MSAPEPTLTPPVAQRRSLHFALGVILLLVFGIRLFLLFTTHATEEDFYITLRYAENLAKGNGLVYNLGEKVLGTTTPLYTLLLTLLIKLNLPPVLGGTLLNILADGLSCWCLLRFGKAMRRPGVGLAAALCLALAPTNLTWAVKGMEVCLVAAAGIAAWTAWAERRELLAWAAAAVLILLRIDGLALAVVLLGVTWLRDRRLPWRGLLLFVALLLPWLIYATLTFGSPIPTSLKAKLIVYAWHAPASFPNILPFLRLMTHNPLALFLALGVLLALLPFKRLETVEKEDGDENIPKSKIPLWLPALLWIAIHYGSMAFSKVFLFGWYFVPPTPVYYLVAMVGWGRLWERGGKLGKGVSVVGVTLGIGVALSLFIVPRVQADLRESQRAESDLRIPIGQWLQTHAAPTDTVMLEPIGYIGYYSGLRVLDTVGLVSPEVLPFYRQEIASPYHALWTRFRPEWILLRMGERRGLTAYEANLPALEQLSTHYQQVQTWAAPSGDILFYLFHRKP